MLHDAANKGVATVREAVDVDLDGVGKIAVDEQRAIRRNDELGGLIERGRQTRHVAVDLGAIGHDLHGPPAQHVGRADHDGIAEPIGDAARFRGRAGNAALGLLERELVDQHLEPVAVLGKVDGVGRGAEDRHARLLERLGELERRLPAELHDHALEAALRLLHGDDLEHVLRRERLEVEAVGGVVVGRDRLGVAVDHDGLGAGLRQREGGMAAAVVELDALADAVGTAAEDHDLVARRGLRLVVRTLLLLARLRHDEPALVGGVHVGGR